MVDIEGLKAQRGAFRRAGLGMVLAAKEVMKQQEEPAEFLEALALLCDTYIDEVTEVLEANDYKPESIRGLPGKAVLGEVQLEFHRYFRKHFGVSNVRQVIMSSMIKGGPVQVLEVADAKRLFLIRAATKD